MIAISIFQSHALENDWVLFIHQKDLTNAILSFTIVTNDRPMRMVVVSAFCPSIDKPDNTPLVYLLLHLHEHWASFCDFVGVNMSKASWRSWDILFNLMSNFFECCLSVCSFTFRNIWEQVFRKFLCG